MDYREELYGELYHYGIKGQKWGIRRFQNEDGTLTTAGKDHYRTGNLQRELNKADRKLAKFKMKEAIYSHKQKKAENKDNEKRAKKMSEKNKAYKELIKDGELRTKELINLAKEKNYTVDSYYHGRSPNELRDTAILLLAPLAYYPVGLTELYRYRNVGLTAAGNVEGKKYKVRDNSN